MAAKWSWKNDQDKWIAYDAKISAKIEKEYKLGRKSCDVDDERFVDILNLLQRRKDDMSKCRLVKREEPLPLSEYVFLLLGDDLLDTWEDDITKHGGLITEYLTDKVTHVVVAKSEVKKHMKKLQEAKKMSLPTLNGDYLKQIIKTDLGGNDTDATDFEVEVEEVAKPKLKASKSDVDAMEVDEQDGQAVDDKKATIDLSKCPARNNSKWMGMHNPKQGKAVSFVFIVTLVSAAGRFMACASWPTRKGLQLHLQGTIKADWSFVLHALDSSVEETTWTGKVSEKSISGNIVGLEGPASFTLSPTTKDEPASLAFLQPNTVVKGVMMQEYPFNFTVSKKDAAKKSKVEGTFVWPTVSNNKTAIKGTCEGPNIEFTEVELLEGDEVQVPVSYQGKFNGTSKTVSGTFKSEDGDAQGRFEFNV
eukprot:TRINITY_DN5548_c0_g1_i1.p1 TRINITY_DN5548_c0_g1~~TRINITY_DN5548_c0_g1_i1.p1  ORF type:complete len:433 (-),score=127.81 TRINITY_DN5548_c0_g1_i1:35-1294(-)